MTQTQSKRSCLFHLDKLAMILLFAFFLSLVSGHDEETNKAEDSKEELIQFNDDNFLELMAQEVNTPDSKKKKNLFVFFTIRDCNECMDHQKQWTKLAKVAHKQFKIARTDCHFDKLVCPNFNIDGFPYTILFKNNKIYRYKGNYEVNDMLDFLSADNYLQGELQNENLKDFFNAITGNDSFLNKLVTLGKEFITWSETQSKALFKRIGLYYWSDNSKLLCFSIVFTGFPTVILTFYAMVLIRWIYNKIFGSSNQRSQGYAQQQYYVPQQQQYQPFYYQQNQQAQFRQQIQQPQQVTQLNLNQSQLKQNPPQHNGHLKQE